MGNPSARSHSAVCLLAYDRVPGGKHQVRVRGSSGEPGSARAVPNPPPGSILLLYGKKEGSVAPKKRGRNDPANSKKAGRGGADSRPKGIEEPQCAAQKGRFERHRRILRVFGEGVNFATTV